MKSIANILWLLTFGWSLALLSLMVGIMLCITIIFIPVGLQYVKLAQFVLMPFGYDFVATNTFGFRSVINVVWAILAGWAVALSYLIAGIMACITIILIPFGLQLFKVAGFVLMPLGKNVKRIS